MLIDYILIAIALLGYPIYLGLRHMYEIHMLKKEAIKQYLDRNGWKK